MPDLTRLAVAGWLVKTGNLQLRYIYDIWTLESGVVLIQITEKIIQFSSQSTSHVCMYYDYELLLNTLYTLFSVY